MQRKFSIRTEQTMESEQKKEEAINKTYINVHTDILSVFFSPFIIILINIWSDLMYIVYSRLAQCAMVRKWEKKREGERERVY